MALTERFVTADSDGGDGSIGDPWTLSEAIANCAAGDRINILSGTYTRTESDTIATAGTVGSPIIFRGVSSFSALTSAYIGRTVYGTGPLDTTNMPVIAYDAGYGATITGSYIILSALRLTANVNGNCLTFNALDNFSTVLFSSVTNVDAGASASAINIGGRSTSIVACDLSITTGGNYQSKALSTNSGAFEVIGCRLTNPSTHSTAAACQTRGGGIFTGSIFTAQNNGIQIATSSGQTKINRCIFYGCPNAAYASLNAAHADLVFFVDNIFSGNAYALLNPYNATAAHPLISINNAYYNNTNANLGFGDWPEQGRIDLASDPFVDAANGDFRLKPGSAARNAGLGGVDCGAIQHVDPTQPATTTVWFGTSYNDGLSTGDMRASDIENCEAGNIKKDVVIDDVTGTYDPVTGNYTDPGVEHVEDGVEYEFAGETLTGTLAGDDPDTVITAAGGNYVEPEAGDLRLGVVAGAGAYEVVGEMAVGVSPVDLQFETGWINAQ